MNTYSRMDRPNNQVIELKARTVLLPFLFSTVILSGCQMTVPRPLMKHIVVEERSISSTVDEQPLSEQQTDKEKLELKLKRQKAQQRA